MRDYPNMSYCMFGNTKLAMDQIIETMLDAGSKENMEISSEEERAYQELYDLCQAFIQQADEFEGA